MTLTFSRHPTLKNKSYLPPGWPTYTATGATGQRFAMWYPKGTAPAAGWPTVVFFHFTNFASSDDIYADNTAGTIGQGTGYLWQWLQNGLACAHVQVSGSDKNNPGGRGFWHPPGASADRNYEDTASQSAFKDVIMAFQHLRYNADTYSIDPNRMAVAGASAGAQAAAYIGLAPNRANALGVGGQHNVSTVPNACWFIQGPFPYFDAYDGSATPSPLVPSSFYAQDHTTNSTVAAAKLDDVDAAYLRTSEWPDWIGGVGDAYIPPSIAWTDTDSWSDLWANPQEWETGVAAADTTALHSAWNQAVLKSWFPGKVQWGVKPENLDGEIDSIVDFLLSGPLSQSGSYGLDEMINRFLNTMGRKPPQWDAEVPPNGIRRAGAVETVGRVAVPPNPARKSVKIYCDNLNGVFVDQSFDQATFKVALQATVEIEGTGPIFIKSPTGLSSFVAIETPA